MTTTYYKQKALEDYWLRDYRDSVRLSVIRAVRNTLEAYGADREIADRNALGILSESYRFVMGRTPPAEDPKLKSKLKEAADALRLIANMDANVNHLIRLQLVMDDACDFRPMTLDYIAERPPLSAIVATASIVAYERMIGGAQRVYERVDELAAMYRRKPGRKRDEARYVFFCGLVYHWKGATHHWPVDWEADTFVEDADAAPKTPRPQRATAPIFRIAQILVKEISRRTGKQPPSNLSGKAFTKALRDMRSTELGPLGPTAPGPRKRGTKAKDDCHKAKKKEKDRRYKTKK